MSCLGAIGVVLILLGIVLAVGFYVLAPLREMADMSDQDDTE